MSQQKVHFVGGITQAQDVQTLKLASKPHVVFAGRSNVGKSSVLNALTGSVIARVSQEPGKTREINFFHWQNLYLVDLPGYGYAKVPQKMRAQWGVEITKFLTTNPQLLLVVSLVDGSVGFTEQDIGLIEFLQTKSVPFLVAFTKMDKYKSANQRTQAEKKLAVLAEDLQIPQYVFVSTKQSGGVQGLYRVIRDAVLAAKL